MGVFDMEFVDRLNVSTGETSKSWEFKHRILAPVLLLPILLFMLICGLVWMPIRWLLDKLGV